MAACLSMLMLASWAGPAVAASGVPPFCVKTGGSRGPDSVPQLCRFFDYQECLWASAQLHGNCVVNIDYHGVVSLTPALGRVQPRRR
jgi:hypothetical protein